MSVNPSTLSVIGDIVGIEGGGSIDFDTDADTIVSGSLPFTDTNWQQGTMIRIVLARDGNEYILGTFDGTAADATIKNGAYSGSIELHSRLDALTITPYQYTISAGTTAKEVISDAFNNSGVKFEWAASSNYRYTSVQNYDVGSEWLTIASDACNLASLRFSVDKTGLVRIIDDFDAFSLSPSVTFTSVPDYHGVRIIGDIKQQTKRMSIPNRIIAATSGDDAKTARLAAELFNHFKEKLGDVECNKLKSHANLTPCDLCCLIAGRKIYEMMEREGLVKHPHSCHNHSAE